VDAELHNTQFIGRQFVHGGEDLLHGAHDRRLQNKCSRSNMSIRRSLRRAPGLETLGAWHKRLYNTSKSACIVTSFVNQPSRKAMARRETLARRERLVMRLTGSLIFRFARANSQISLRWFTPTAST